jgi:hypothetical protein
VADAVSSLSDEQLLESLDRHFMAGCGFLDAAQPRSHQTYGSCLECTERADLAARNRMEVTRG